MEKNIKNLAKSFGESFTTKSLRLSVLNLIVSTEEGLVKKVNKPFDEVNVIEIDEGPSNF